MADPDHPYFSILIPSWNNLAYLRCCIRSIRGNSTFQHEIIVHVNEGDDGTTDYLRSENIPFTFSEDNSGVCKALNSAYRLATSDLIVYMNDDMYVCPGWDEALLNAVKEAGNEMCYLSATMIEPADTGNPCVIAPADFGRSVETFREKELLQRFPEVPKADWSGATWPPSLVHRRLWDAVEGYSEEFSPGLYSDPDFSMKLWRQGVRIFRGVGNSRVYHFQSKSLNRVKLNNGRKQFARKWGIPASYFRRHFLRTGKPYTGPLPEPLRGPGYWMQKCKALMIK